MRESAIILKLKLILGRLSAATVERRADQVMPRATSGTTEVQFEDVCAVARREEMF